MRLMFDWSTLMMDKCGKQGLKLEMITLQLRAEWRFASTDNGAQFVIIHGISQRPKLSVVN